MSHFRRPRQRLLNARRHQKLAWFILVGSPTAFTKIKCAHTSHSSVISCACDSRVTKRCALRPFPYGVCQNDTQTGQSKHYGFIEFESGPVAQIVAETMDNYLLMGHILTCKVIPNDEVHPELWVGANRKWRVVPNYRLAQAQHNKVSSCPTSLGGDSE